MAIVRQAAPSLFLSGGLNGSANCNSLLLYSMGHADVPGPCGNGRCRCESNASLSPRERQILISIAEGKSNKLIARQFSLTESTVKVHLKAVLRKLGKQNRTQAAIWAIEHGLVHGSIVPDATEA